MVTEPGQEAFPTSSAPLTLSETLNYYLAMNDILYEESVRDPNSETVHVLQRVVLALRYELTSIADANGVVEVFRSAIRQEQAEEKHALLVRKTANRVAATRVVSWLLLSLLLLSLPLSCAVFYGAYAILDMDWSLGLLSLPLMIWFGFWLPWFMDRLATYEERKLRELRHIADDTQPEWWAEDLTILHIT